jgi:hypothetical protein
MPGLLATNEIKKFKCGFNNNIIIHEEGFTPLSY